MADGWVHANQPLGLAIMKLELGKISPDSRVTAEQSNESMLHRPAVRASTLLLWVLEAWPPSLVRRLASAPLVGCPDS